VARTLCLTNVRNLPQRVFLFVLRSAIAFPREVWTPITTVSKIRAIYPKLRTNWAGLAKQPRILVDTVETLRKISRACDKVYRHAAVLEGGLCRQTRGWGRDTSSCHADLFVMLAVVFLRGEGSDAELSSYSGQCLP
jgi:hypothetical protein